jgi:hypothetical protein
MQLPLWTHRSSPEGCITVKQTLLSVREKKSLLDLCPALPNDPPWCASRLHLMKADFEITDRFLEPGDAGDLLYSPPSGNFTYRKTRRYEFDFKGDEVKLNSFVADTLVDQISQTMLCGVNAAYSGAQFTLDYGMKPGALDLEKEAIVSYYKGLKNPGFELNHLKIRQRIYLFPDQNGPQADPQTFVRDICNAAVHNWNII